MASRGVLVSFSKSHRPAVLHRRFYSLKNDLKKEQYLSKQWKSTAAAPVVSADAGGSSAAEAEKYQKDELDLTFENAKDAYKSKSTWEIVRAIMVLKLTTSDFLVENNQKVRFQFLYDVFTCFGHKKPQLDILMFTVKLTHKYSYSLLVTLTNNLLIVSS